MTPEERADALVSAWAKPGPDIYLRLREHIAAAIREAVEDVAAERDRYRAALGRLQTSLLRSDPAALSDVMRDVLLCKIDEALT